MTRLPSRMLVDLLFRSASAAGGFATLLARGDDHGGTILIQCRDRDSDGPLLERQFDGEWHTVGPDAAPGTADRADYVARRRRIDPDLWLIELDIAKAPQFVANLNPPT
jgi:hypothetical protein